MSARHGADVAALFRIFFRANRRVLSVVLKIARGNERDRRSEAPIAGSDQPRAEGGFKRR
jgi:hypothetical protein